MNTFNLDSLEVVHISKEAYVIFKKAYDENKQLKIDIDEAWERNKKLREKLEEVASYQSDNEAVKVITKIADDYLWKLAAEIY